jgi:predicted nucleotidyltransferase component of viral defense system
MNDSIKYILQKYSIITSEDQKNALQEIIQEIVLMGLSRSDFFKQAAFYGGTALRVLYGLDRFSEDLDFTALNKAFKGFKHYKKNIEEILESYGFEFEFIEKIKKLQGPVESAFIKGNTSINLLNIGILYSRHKDEKTKIKLEIDTQPASGFHVDTVLHTQPEPFYLETLDLPSLFSGKLHAILFRQRQINIKGRDWYDLSWFLSKGIQYNFEYLKNKIAQSFNHLDNAPDDLRIISPTTIQEALRNRLEQMHIDDAKKDIGRFIRVPSTLNIWSKNYFIDVINRLQDV